MKNFNEDPNVLKDSIQHCPILEVKRECKRWEEAVK